MQGKTISLLSAWLAAVALCLPASGAAEPEVHTLFIELAEPYETNRVTLQTMLRAEGHEAHPEGERELSLVLTAAGLRKLFHARVVQRKMEKSATHGMASHPLLEGARVPQRFRNLIRRVYLDPQRG